MSPRHLAPLTEALERARHSSVRAIVSVPPRHAKTETVLHAIAWWLRHDPTKIIGYASYSADFAYSKSRRARYLAALAGVELGEVQKVAEWCTTAGGGVLATGIGGPLTGHGVDVLLVDDPVKNRIEAESSTTRQQHWEWWEDVASTRIEPGGSAFVIMTRWHVDDLAGRLEAAEPGRWQVIRLPAMSEDAEERPLWPERWPKEQLLQRRAERGVYSWAGLFQQRPVPRGGKIFNAPRTYRELPTEGLRWGIGLDLAYGAKTSSDWSVAVLVAEAKGVVYVVDVKREQLRAPDFAPRVKLLQKSRAAARARWYASGTELGSAQFMREEPYKLDLEALNAGADKLIRATPYAAAWNAGEVLVPESGEWVDEFVTEHMNFTGSGKEHDDQVDAGAAGFDLVTGRGSNTGMLDWLEGQAKAAKLKAVK